MSDNRHFYQSLPALGAFQDAFREGVQAPVPQDWWVVVADVANSTTAIEQGRYKKVNTVGVACIAALMNIDRSIEIPYVFGGDGAIFALPEAIIEQARSSLRSTQALARKAFGLELRVGLVRVGALEARGYHVALAKVALSDSMTQASLTGTGWEEAERLVKSAEPAGVELLTEADAEQPAANYDGFECRWRSVQSFHGHKLALLVAAMPEAAGERLSVYQDVLAQVHAIYGQVDECHPLRASGMHLTLNPYALGHEAQVRTHRRGAWARLRYLLLALLKNLAGRYIFWRNLDTRAVRWSRYRDELVENTDFRKFDGVLRMIIDGNEQQFQQLQSYLEGMFRDGRIAYGMHKSDQALVTCLVQSHTGSHVHFVDGSDGGYALAAKELKHRVQALKRAQAAAPAG